MTTFTVFENTIQNNIQKVEKELKSAEHYKTSFSAVFKKRNLLSIKNWFNFSRQHAPIVFSSIGLFAVIVAFVYFWVLKSGDGTTLISSLGFISAIITVLGGAVLAFTIFDFLEELSFNDVKSFYKVEENKSYKKLSFSQKSHSMNKQGDQVTCFEVHDEISNKPLAKIEYIGDQESEFFQDFLVRLDSLLSDINKNILGKEQYYFSSLENFKSEKSLPKIEEIQKDKRFYNNNITFVWGSFVTLVSITLLSGLIFGIIVRMGADFNNYTQYKSVTQAIKEHSWAKNTSLEDVKAFVEQRAFKDAKHLDTLENIMYCTAKDKGKNILYIKYVKKAVSDEIFEYNIQDMGKAPETISYVEDTECDKIKYSFPQK